ncbi:MAG: YfhO family protein [Magnetococcus sp. YQC-9]
MRPLLGFLLSVPDSRQSDHPRQWMVFWLVWSLLISAIYWIFGPYSYLRIQDNADFNIPLRITAARDLLTHGLIYWQPKFSSGMPYMLHPNIDSFLVDGLPYLFLPAWAVHSLIMWLQRFLASYFTFRICRDILKLDPLAATFSGMAFSLHLWGVQDLKLVEALGLPAIGLTLLLFERLFSLPVKRSHLLALLLGIVTALIAQSVIYTFFILVGLPFWFWIARARPFATLWSRCLAFAIGITLGEAPQLIALFFYTPVTTRGQGHLVEPIPIPSLSDIIHHTWEIVGWNTLPQNGLYLALFLFGMVLAKGERNWAWRLLALHLITGFGSEIGLWLQCLFQQWIPPSRGNLRDLNQFTIFIGPLLGGAGLHLARLRLASVSQPTRVLIGASSAIALLLPLISWKETTLQLLHRLSTDNFALHFQNPVLRKLGELSDPSSAPFRVGSIGTWAPTIASASGGRIYPAEVYAYGLEGVDGYYRLHSARYHQFWRRIVAKSLAAYPEQDERTSKWYYLFRRPEERFAERQPLNLNAWFNMNLLSLANTRFLISQWPLQHPALTVWHDPTAELIQGREWEEKRLREKIWLTLKHEIPHNAYYVYENHEALPRLIIPERVRLFDDGSALLDALERAEVKELAHTAFLERRDFSEWAQNAPRLTPGQARFTRYTPDHLEIIASTTGGGLLVVTNNHDPYWRVTINGESGTIRPVDHTFQGIVLPAGESRLVLDYVPPYRFGRITTEGR